jgi:voltage-gated potassium channel
MTIARSKAVYEIVEGGRFGSARGRAFDAFIGSAVLIAVASAVLSTDAVFADWLPTFDRIEGACAVIFAVEYFARVWVSADDRQNRYNDGWRGRLRYMMTAMAIIDLLAFVPIFAALFVNIDADDFLLLRLIRLFKLLRYFSAFETLAVVLSNERKPMFASGILMIILLIVMSTLGYLAERNVQPQAFGSIPQSMWWGIVTLATIGYGDVVPQTVLGKVIGGLTSILGLGMFALPAGIVASGFAEEMRRRNFMVTWTLVSSVPFFEHLPASRIAEIASSLEPRSASRGEAIIRQGDPADGMYFLIEGECDVMIGDTPIRLKDGDFFGEMALLSARPRSVSIIARGFTRLLKLRVDHFHRLMENHPDLAAAMRKVSDDRQKSMLVPPSAPTNPG